MSRPASNWARSRVAAQDRLVHLLTSCAGGHLQLQGLRAISRRPSSVRTCRRCSATRRGNTWRVRISGDAPFIPRICPRSRRRRSSYSAKATIHLQYRFRRKDGRWCWVNDEQRLVRDGAGQPEEIVGSWTDITERKLAEEAMAAASAWRVEHLVASSPAVIYSFKANGRLSRPRSSARTSRSSSATTAPNISRVRTSGQSRVHPQDQAARAAGI